MKSKKIAVLRANALGDFIFVLPALQAIKERWPEGDLVYLGCPWHRDFLKKRTPVDRVICLPVSFRQLQQERFDLAFQMHGGGKNSNPFVKQLGAKVTVGLQDHDAPPLDINVPYIYYQSEYVRYLEVVKAAGGKVTTAAPNLKVFESDFKACKQALPELTKPYVVMHPGATDSRRRWPIQKFAVIGKWLVSQGFRVVVTGEEQELIHSLVAKIDTSLNAGGRLTLQALTGLLAGAELIVSNDTGPYHLAVAVDTPAVGMWWCGNAITSAPPYKTKWRQLISWQVTCPLCGMDVATPGRPFQPNRKTGCQHLVSFVESISVEEVKREIGNVLRLAKVLSITNTPVRPMDK